jgi:hypothetical protein
MIKRNDIPGDPGKVLQSLSGESDKPEGSTTIYKSVQWLTDFTKKALREGNTALAKKCFDAAETIMRSGSIQFRNAVSNIFLSGLSNFMDASVKSHELLMQFLYGETRKEYLRQIYSCCD